MTENDDEFSVTTSLIAEEGLFSKISLEIYEGFQQVFC
jgi:hypothetical protein